MTAANIVICRDRVELYTDSAACGLDGRLRRLVSKVRTLPAMRCAITARGELRAIDALAAILPTVGDNFDDLRTAAADGRLGAALGRWRSLLNGRFSLLVPFDLVVAGWSAKGPAAFIFTNHGRMRGSGGGTGPVAWTPFDVPWAVIMPTVRLSREMSNDPGGNMPKIMARQRKHLEPSLLIPAGRRMVGGAIEKTTITANGVVKHRVGGWNDAIGQSISGGTAHRKAWLRAAVLLTAIWVAIFAGNVVLQVAFALLQHAMR